MTIFMTTLADGPAEMQAPVDGDTTGEVLQIDIQPADGEPLPTLTFQNSSIRHVAKPGRLVLASTTLTCALAFLIILCGFILPVLFAFTAGGGPLAGAWSRVNPLAYARQELAFGAPGSGQGRLDDPRQIGVDGEGRIYVADYMDGRVQVFDRQGNFLALWRVAPERALQGLVVDHQGRVYLAQEGEVGIYNGMSGERLGSLPAGDETAYYSEIAMGADGSLVATARGETLVFFNPERQVTLVIPAAVSSVSNDSELDTRLAVDGLGNVYALGTFNDAVFKFSPQGRFLTRFGSAGDGNGQFRAPLDIAADALGRVYVSDVKGVQVFDADGRYLASIQVPGAAFGLAFDDLNRLYVVTNTPKVLRFQVQEP